MTKGITRKVCLISFVHYLSTGWLQLREFSGKKSYGGMHESTNWATYKINSKHKRHSRSILARFEKQEKVLHLKKYKKISLVKDRILVLCRKIYLWKNTKIHAQFWSKNWSGHKSSRHVPNLYFEEFPNPLSESRHHAWVDACVNLFSMSSQAKLWRRIYLCRLHSASYIPAPSLATRACSWWITWKSLGS